MKQKKKSENCCCAWCSATHLEFHDRFENQKEQKNRNKQQLRFCITASSHTPIASLSYAVEKAPTNKHSRTHTGAHSHSLAHTQRDAKCVHNSSDRVLGARSNRVRQRRRLKWRVTRWMFVGRAYRWWPSVFLIKFCEVAEVAIIPRQV
jgi:hypothetical protein